MTVQKLCILSHTTLSHWNLWFWYLKENNPQQFSVKSTLQNYSIKWKNKWPLDFFQTLWLSIIYYLLSRWSLSSKRKGNDRKLSLTHHKSPSLRKLYCHQYHLEHLTIANQKLQFQLATISLWYVFYYLCYNFMLSYDREF